MVNYSRNNFKMGDDSAPAKKIRITGDDSSNHSNPDPEKGIYLRELQTNPEIEKLDPVIEHMIKLRQFYITIKDSIFEAEEESKKQQKETLEDERGPQMVGDSLPENFLHQKKTMRSFVLPEFPERCALKKPHKAIFNMQKNKEQVKLESQLMKNEVKEIIKDFVKKVLTQTGFYVQEDIQIDEEPVSHLTFLTDIYLKKFSLLMWEIKSSKAFSESDDLWGLLETTLRKMNCIAGFHRKNPTKVVFEENLQAVELSSIETLHAFYYENIIKKHDVLYNKCKKLLRRYNSLRNNLGSDNNDSGDSNSLWSYPS